jgi:PAS domain S-box-containing protein
MASSGDRLTLQPEPLSAARAREFVADALAMLNRPELIDAAQLAVSELVTNAVLHANTEIEVTVLATEGGVRIEVCDDHPGLPAARRYGDYATTGRGLGLVGAMAADLGVEPKSPTGKRIWFTLTAEAAEDLLYAEVDWNIDELLEGTDDAAPDDGHLVLKRLPLMLWGAAQEHHDAVLRELMLYRPSTAPADARGAELAAARKAEALLASAIDVALSRALTEEPGASVLPKGHPSPFAPEVAALDVTIPSADDAHGLFSALQDVLDEAEQLAAEGLLLVRPALPEIIAVRDWCCEQVVAQANGVPPAPWTGTDREVFTRADSDRFQTASPEWDDTIVRDSDRYALAADDNNRLVAVSLPMAEAIGWKVADLVGRRVVTLVPSRFREAHVAGFTRHLTTGEAHALGVELDLPVLHADGHEITFTFLIERASATPGRTVYVAWLRPVADATGSAA